MQELIHKYLDTYYDMTKKYNGYHIIRINESSTISSFSIQEELCKLFGLPYEPCGRYELWLCPELIEWMEKKKNKLVC